MDALADLGVKTDCVVVFGSAVGVSNGEHKNARNPGEWDIDLLWLTHNESPLKGRDTRIITKTGKTYLSRYDETSGELLDIQEEGSLGYPSPKKGLHVQLAEIGLMTRFGLRDFEKTALTQGKVVIGSIPDEIKKVL